MGGVSSPAGESEGLPGGGDVTTHPSPQGQGAETRQRVGVGRAACGVHG